MSEVLVPGAEGGAGFQMTIATWLMINFGILAVITFAV
jgi:hypothetical protein